MIIINQQWGFDYCKHAATYQYYHRLWGNHLQLQLQSDSFARIAAFWATRTEQPAPDDDPIFIALPFLQNTQFAATTNPTARVIIHHRFCCCCCWMLKQLFPTNCLTPLQRLVSAQLSSTWFAALHSPIELWLEQHKSSSVRFENPVLHL